MCAVCWPQAINQPEYTGYPLDVFLGYIAKLNIKSCASIAAEVLCGLTGMEKRVLPWAVYYD